MPKKAMGDEDKSETELICGTENRGEELNSGHVIRMITKKA